MAVRTAIVLGSVGLAIGLGSVASAQGVVFPADAGVINITQPPYSAVGDGLTDNTAAFQQAINDAVDKWRVIYVPDGVYLFSDQLSWGRGDGGGFPFGFALRLQGQSRAGTILRLTPNAPFFQNNYDANCDGAANESKVFLDLYQPIWNIGSTPPWRDCSGGNTANAFGNEIHDLSIEIGDGNPGATAVQFQSSNFGSMRNVTVRALSPTTGRTGIDMGFEFPGPLLLKDIAVDGFDNAIVGAPQEYSVTIQNLTTLNQRTRGVYVWRLPLQVQNWTHTGPAPALFSDANPGAWGHVVIDNATFTGNGATAPAISNAAGAGSLMIRNLTVAGYPTAISDLNATGGVASSTPAGVIARYCTDPSFSLTGTGGLADNWLNLPQADAAVPSPPLSAWANVRAFGAVPDDNLDDTAAIQAAMDSGAAAVYFPTGGYAVSDTITLGPSVQRVVGLKSALGIWSGLWMRQAPVFRVPGTQPT
ncbi:MAG: glycoside hydrolase family 55 protein, partial [Phycisphaerales bacterium]|nr:glycoside hydrolase family 55 protein [Phycisphaerales bacterium]